MINNVCQNNLRDAGFGREIPRIFCLENAAIAENQGVSEGKDIEAKPSLPKSKFSGGLEIKTVLQSASATDPKPFENPKILLPGEKLEGHGITVINSSDIPITIHYFGPAIADPDERPSSDVDLWYDYPNSRVSFFREFYSGGIFKVYYDHLAPISEQELLNIEKKFNERPKPASTRLLKQLRARA